LLLLTAASVLIPLLRMDLPDLLLRWLGTVAGSLASAGCLLLPASFLLGAAGPLVVAAATTELGEVGRRSGSLNGASHLGAIVGTLVTGYVLIPTLPVSRVLGLTAGVLTLAAVVLHRARASTGWRAR
jgi:predicted membrane-bound spermidine synthase